MWVFDDETLCFLEVNEAACQKYGYSREEFLSMNLLDIRSPEEQELFKNREEHSGRAWEHLTKSGDVLFIQGYEFPFEVDGRKAILALISDETERIKLERERTDLLQRYQILSEAANDLLWDWDLKTNQVTLNEALITQYGYDRSQLQQPITWWSDKIHPDDYSTATWSVAEAMKEKQRYWTAEYRFKKADGSWVQVLDRGIIQFNEDGEPVRMIGSIVDLTKRRAAEDDRNQLFRLSIDSMLFLDPSGNITRANAAFYSLTGVEVEATTARNMRDFLSPDDRPIYDDVVKKALSDGVDGHFTSSISTEDGTEKTIEWGMITNESRSRLFLVGRDITESKAAQQELEEALVRSRQLAIEAQAARKAQTEFLQNMSHELRTPMNGMLGTAQLLAASTHDEKHRNLATILVRSGESLLQIVNDILDFSKIESGNIDLDRAPFRLAEAVQIVFDLFSLPARQKGLTYTTSISDQAKVCVVGDHFRLRQVISNLIGNAVKFTDKGSIDVSLNVRTNSFGLLEATIKVSDTGAGIAPDLSQRVFERFFQADSSPTRRHGGTGLGLSISKTVVELMGGTIELETGIGSGSQFTVRVPFPVSTEPDDACCVSEHQAMCSKPGAKVLIAEDVEVNAMILTSWLEERGFECVTVETGYEAIHALSSQAFDGAFVDLHMPGASGYDVVREFRKFELGASKRMPVVAVTASVSVEERLQCLSEGFDDYIPKPILVGELDRVVARLF